MTVLEEFVKMDKRLEELIHYAQESTDTVYSAGNADIDTQGDLIVQSGMIAARNQIVIDSDRTL